MTPSPLEPRRRRGFRSLTRLSALALVGGTLSVLGLATTAHADGPSGPVYVADENNNRIVEVAADGTQSSVWGSFSAPTAVDTDAAGNAYVSEYNGDLYKIATDGTRTLLVSDGSCLYDVAVDSVGNAYLANLCAGHVLKVPADGGPSSSIYSGAVLSVAVDSHDNVYAADFSGGKVVEIATDGTQTQLATLALPGGVALDSADNLYVSWDYFNGGSGKLDKITPAHVETTIATTDTSRAMGIDVDSDGTVYLADRDGGRVVAVGPDGTQSTFATGFSGPTGVSVASAAQTPQDVEFTSVPPAPASIGGTYHPTATGGDSGNPVVFTIDPATTQNACSIDAGTVTFRHAGTCVIAADQAAADGYSAGHATQSVSVGLSPQTVTFTSTPPDPAYVGDTYAPTATGGSSGNPVVFSIDPATTHDACSISGGTVTLQHPGTCVIAADQIGDTVNTTAGHATQSFAVGQDLAFTTSAPDPAHVGDTYQPQISGDTATDPAQLAVNGPCSLSGGVVTFTGLGECVITAYSGDDPSLPGTATQSVQVEPSHPSITATVTSSRAKTRFGWYRRPVTITYACDADGSTLTGACPDPVTIRRSGENITRTRTISTADGGSDSVTTTVDLDRVRPTVHATHVHSGRTYHQVPRVGCRGHDALSGIARCAVHQRVVDGRRLVYRAIARDKAGNRAVDRGHVDLALGRGPALHS